MPIEIKELHIQIKVGKEKNSNPFSNNDPVDIKKLKADLIKICTRSVLEKINEKQQR